MDFWYSYFWYSFLSDSPLASFYFVSFFLNFVCIVQVLTLLLIKEKGGVLYSHLPYVRMVFGVGTISYTLKAVGLLLQW